MKKKEQSLLKKTKTDLKTMEEELKLGKKTTSKKN